MNKEDYDKIIGNFREKFINTQIKVPLFLQADANGYLDRKCHKCGYLFKVDGDQLEELNANQFCPLCKFEAPKEKWDTPEQESKKQEQIQIGLQKDLGDKIHIELGKMYDNDEIDNSYQIDGFPFQNEYIPEEVRALSQIEIHCDNCNINYAIFGSAYFCPNCGKKHVEKVFSNIIGRIEIKVRRAKEINEINTSRDEDIILSRSLIETSLNDCVLAFQLFNEDLFKRRFPSISIRQNLFQNIDEGEKLWKASQTKGYSNILSSSEYVDLKILFQRRHLLSHTDGIVDAKYLTNTNDTEYKEGQRITVSVMDIEKCIALITKIASDI